MMNDNKKADRLTLDYVQKIRGHRDIESIINNMIKANTMQPQDITKLREHRSLESVNHYIKLRD